MSTHALLLPPPGRIPRPPPPPVLARGLLDTQVSQGRTALPDEEEPVLFRRVVIQPLGEACVGPFCPLQG